MHFWMSWRPVDALVNYKKVDATIKKILDEFPVVATSVSVMTMMVLVFADSLRNIMASFLITSTCHEK